MANRREFNRLVAGAGLLSGLGDWSGLVPLSPLHAQQQQVTPDLVRLRPEIEPIVRQIEQTPREHCFAMMLRELQRGLSYRHFLAALMLAGVRNVNPQPPGFKFHCVFVVQSAHQLSLDAPAGDRLLPLFWVLDEFKKSQQRDVEEGDFKLAPLTGKLPSANRAWAEFHDAMRQWDELRADRAISALVRTRGAGEITEQLWKYGARDYRNIGHKPIFVANAIRTLETIGWRHAEPILRSLVLGLLDYGADERVNQYAFEDQCFLSNEKRTGQLAARLPGNWAAGEADPARTLELLQIMRSMDTEQACQQAADWLAGGEAQATCLWDAVHLAAGELMMRQPGIYGIHTVTSVNGLRYAFEQAASPATRMLMLLQGIGWMCQFTRFMAGTKKGLGKQQITALGKVDIAADPGDAVSQLLADVGKKSQEAASQAFALGLQDQHVDLFVAEARRLVFLKNTDAHGFKYPVAIFEDYRRVSPAWRPHMLATATYYLSGSSRPDSPVMQRAREAVSQLG